MKNTPKPKRPSDPNTRMHSIMREIEVISNRPIVAPVKKVNSKRKQK